MARSRLRRAPLEAALLFGAVCGAQSAFAQRGSAAAAAEPSPAPVTIAFAASDGYSPPVVADLAALLPTSPRDMRIFPVIGASELQNMADLLAPGPIDLALMRADGLDDARDNVRLAGGADELRYVARLVDASMHVLAGPDIVELRQLAGRRVAVGGAGSADRFSAARILASLGISVEAIEAAPTVAIERLRRGEIAAVVLFASPPDVRIAALENTGGLHLVAAPWDARLSEAYLPATIDAGVYPDLLRPGERVETISVGEVLVAAQASAGGARAARLAGFVDALFSRLPELQRQSRNPAWRDVNLAARLSGWTRLAAAQDWLDGKRGDALRLAWAPAPAAAKASEARPAAPVARASNDDEFARFKRFVARKRGKSGERLAADDTVVMFGQFQKWRDEQ